MDSPIEEHPDVPGVYNSMIYDPHWLSDTRNDSNPYPSGAQMFNDPSSSNTVFDPSGSSTNQWPQSGSPVQRMYTRTMSTAPSVRMSNGLDMHVQHVPKRQFDASTDRSQNIAQAKRRKRNDSCETPRSQKIPTDWIDEWINEIVQKVQPKMAALATLSDIEVDELNEHFLRRLSQRFVVPTFPSTQFGEPGSTAPAFVQYPLRSRPDDSMLSTPVQQTPNDRDWPSPPGPRRKTELKRNRAIVPCRRTKDENLLERDEKRRYQCTRKCGKRFRRKDDWKRHELKASPQDGWLCMVGLFYEQDGEPLCRFCAAPCTSADHFKDDHPAFMQTRTPRCQYDPSCGKLIVSNRKDHFRQHFDCRHSDISATQFEKMEAMSRFRILYEGEWRCGFCPPYSSGFGDWNTWWHHVANHFERDGKSIKDWLDHTEWPKAVLQHAASEDDASSDDDDNNGGEGPSGTNGNWHKDPPDIHSDSSDGSDDDDETPRSNGYGPQTGYNGFWRAGKGTCGAQVLRCVDHITVASAHESSKLSTRTNDARPIASPKHRLQRAGRIQLQESANILRRREENAHTKMSASAGGKDQSPENGSAGAPPEARRYRTFEQIKVLGTGSYSVVEEVLHLPTRLRCVRKTSKADQRSQHQHLHVEFRTLQRLRHQHIIRLLDSFSIGTKLSLLLAPVAESNLAEYLDMATRFTSECRSHLKRFLGCLISAMAYIHESSLTHGDIKPANILVTNGPSPNVLLCDFGAAQSVTNSIKSTNHDRPLTMKYCAPEVVSGQCRGVKADMWSLGCVFLEVSVFLFAENRSKLQDFKSFFSADVCYYKELSKISYWLKYSQIRSATSENHIPETIRSMLQPEPLHRPTAASLVGRFPPAPCCLAESMTSLRRVSSFDALYDLAVIRSVPELANHSQSCQEHTGVSRYLDADSTLCAEALDKICSEFTRLALAQYRLQASTDGIRSCKSWLQICAVSHRGCAAKETDFAPTRLLEVAFGSKPILTLRSLTDFQGVKPRYAALSYVCHSDGHFFSFRRSLVENHTIDVDELPPKLAKAISAVHQLGCQYLWVDSLCINQDDIEKGCFAIEDMAQIYQNADVTVMFSGSANFGDARDKVLSQPDSGSSLVEDLGSERPECPRYDVALCRRNVRRRDADLTSASSLEHGRPTHLSDTNFQSAHALTQLIRAWTLHSSLLSKRRIVFTDDDVQWECQSLLATSTFPGGLDPYLWESIYGKWEQRITRCTCRYPQTSPRSNRTDRYPQTPPRSNRTDRYPQTSPRSECTDRYPQTSPRSNRSDRYPQTSPRSNRTDRYGQTSLRSSRIDRYPQSSPRSNLISMSTDIALYDFWAVVVARYTSKASGGSRNQTDAYTGLLPVAEKMRTAIKDNFFVGLWERSLSWSLLWKVDTWSGGEELIHRQGKRRRFPSWSWAGWAGTVHLPRHTPGRSLITILKVDAGGEEDSVPGRIVLRGPMSSAGRVQSVDAEILTIHVALPLHSNAQPGSVNVAACFDNGPDMAARSNELFAIWVWLAIPGAATGPAIGGILLEKDEENEKNVFRRCGILELSDLPVAVNGNMDESAADLGFLEGLTREITIL